MHASQTIKTSLKHPGTGRPAAVLQVEDFWSTSPVSIGAGKYVLFIASERRAALSSTEAARAWVEAGASYICAWGPTSPEVEEAFDHASFLPECGEPLTFTLMTTSHKDEALDEALWFAFYCATPPDDLDHELRSVVVVVESSALKANHAMNPSKVDRSCVVVLTDLPNIGEAGAQDLRLLGIHHPSQLVGKRPFEMHEALCAKKSTRHDPCVIDVFMSVTRFMGGEEPRSWWAYTEERKQLLKQRGSNK